MVKSYRAASADLDTHVKTLAEIVRSPTSGPGTTAGDRLVVRFV